MAKQSPIPDELSKPFWDACNEDRLVMQTCTACDRMQYPPDQTCYQCDSKDNLEWRQVSGRGKVHGYAVMHDCRIRTLQEDQPFNLAIVELEEDPGIKMYSHLRGTTDMEAKAEVYWPDWENWTVAQRAGLENARRQFLTGTETVDIWVDRDSNLLIRATTAATFQSVGDEEGYTGEATMAISRYNQAFNIVAPSQSELRR